MLCNSQRGWRHFCYYLDVKPTLAITIFSLMLVACSNLSTPSSHPHVGILMYGDSRHPQIEGFIQGMENLGYVQDENIRFTILNTNSHREQLDPMAESLQLKTPDLLVAAGGLEAEALKLAVSENEIPVVVLYASAIVQRGLIQHRLKPGWNVTGVDSLNTELTGKRLSLMHDLIPDARDVLVLYTPDIVPSALEIKLAQEMADKLGLKLHKTEVFKPETIHQVMASEQAHEFDVVFTTSTAVVNHAMLDIILPHALQLGIPVFTHSSTMVESGAYASYGSSAYEMGKQASRLAVKILHGTPPSSIPFETPDRFVYALNEGTRIKLQLTLNDVARAQINTRID